MFITSGYISVYDANWNYVLGQAFTAQPVGPGGFQDTVKIPLAAGQTYNIYAYTKNDNEVDPNYYYQTYAYRQATVNASGDTYIDITLQPYGTYSLDSTNSYTQTQIVKSSVYVPGATPQDEGVFTTMGGEKWFNYYTQYNENVVNFTITPPAGTFVYAALYDASGSFLSAGLSPSFLGGIGDTVILESGATGSSNVYLGVITVEGSPTGTSTDRSVAVAKVAATVADDQYEDNDTSGTASTALALGQTYSLLALDKDYFQFTLPSTGPLNLAFTTTQMTDLDITVSNSTGMMVYSNYLGGNTSFTMSTSNLAAGSYTVGIHIQGYSEVGFPLAGGAYTLTASQAGQVTALNANSDFADNGYSDYSYWWSGPISNWTSYINQPGWEQIPGWSYNWDSAYVSVTPNQDVGVWTSANDYGIEGNAVHLSSPSMYGNTSVWTMSLSDSFTAVTVGSTTKLAIKFKIIDFYGNNNQVDVNFPYYEAPVRLWLQVDGAWVLARTYSPLESFVDTLGQYVPYNSWINDEISLVDLPQVGLDDGSGSVSGYGSITSSSQVTGIKVDAKGFYWDILLDTVQIHN